MKVIKPTVSVFEYNPKTNELRLVSELAFNYDFTKHLFLLDRNPHGEPNLKEINNVRINEDASELYFDSIFRKKEAHFLLKSDFYFNKLIHQTISSFKEDIRVDKDLDHITLICENDKFEKLYIYKNNQEYKLLDSLTIINENNTLYLIQNRPSWAKIEIDNKIEVSDGNLYYWVGDTKVCYKLDICESVYNIFAKFFN